MALTVAGTRAPPSYCASLRAARILAAINSTRLRPSSTSAVYHFRFMFANRVAACLGRQVAEPHGTGIGTLTWLQRLWRLKDRQGGIEGGNLNEDGGEVEQLWLNCG